MRHHAPNSLPHNRRLRTALIILLGVIAVNAFAGGYYGMAGAEGVPIEWLEGSPFSNFVLPSIVLFAAVGGSALIAMVLVALRSSYARASAQIAGSVLLIWITVQIAIIGYVSWLQPAMIAAGGAIVALSARYQEG